MGAGGGGQLERHLGGRHPRGHAGGAVRGVVGVMHSGLCPHAITLPLPCNLRSVLACCNADRLLGSWQTHDAGTRAAWATRHGCPWRMRGSHTSTQWWRANPCPLVGD